MSAGEGRFGPLRGCSWLGWGLERVATRLLMVGAGISGTAWQMRDCACGELTEI